MSNTVKPFPTPVLLALKALLETDLDSGDSVGGDFSYVGGSGFYQRIGLVDSRSDRFGGTFVVDVEVWGSDYLETESRANRVEALLLGYPHVVEVDSHTWVFDTVSQNTGPRELPWEDDEVTRLGGTYVITARRR